MRIDLGQQIPPPPRLQDGSPRSGHPAGTTATRAACLALNQGDPQEVGSLFAFVTWRRKNGMLPDILPVLAQLQAFFPIYAELSGGAAVTAMDPGLIAEHVGLLNERDADLASFFSAVLFEYMHFLRDTGRWSRHHESHRVLHDVLYRTGFSTKNSSPWGGHACEPEAVAPWPPARVRDRHWTALEKLPQP